MRVEVILRLVRQLPIRKLHRVVTLRVGLSGYRLSDVFRVFL